MNNTNNLPIRRNLSTLIENYTRFSDQFRHNREHSPFDNMDDIFFEFVKKLKSDVCTGEPLNRNEISEISMFIRDRYHELGLHQRMVNDMIRAVNRICGRINIPIISSSGGSKFIHIKNIGKRKIRYYKNGNPYVIINGKKKKKTPLENGDLISFGILEGIIESSSLPKLPPENYSPGGLKIIEKDIVFEENQMVDILWFCPSKQLGAKQNGVAPSHFQR